MKRILTLALAGFLFCTACATAPAASFGGAKDSAKSGSGKNSLNTVPAPLPPAVAPEVEAKLAVMDIAGAIARYEGAVAALPSVNTAGAAASASERAASLDPSVAADLALARNLIASAVESLSLEVVSAPDATTAKKAFKKPFSVQLAGPSGASLPGVPLRIEAPSFGDDGTVSLLIVTAESGFDGLASWEAPAPTRSADSVVRFSAAYRSSEPELAAALEAAGSGNAAEIPYLAGTLNKAIPTSISFLDYGTNGKPIGGMGLTATACLKPLVKMGFTRIGMADFQSQLASSDEPALIAAAKKLFGAAVDRLIYGTTKVVSTSKDEAGVWTATVAVDVAVWNFKADTKTWSGRCEATATGKSEAAAVAAARDSVAGNILPLKLYYNL